VNEVPLSDSEKDGLSVNIMNSWALYVSVIMLGLLGVGMLWSYRKDKRDALNFNQLRSDKDKLYIGVFLEPIVIARKEK